jgi:hypothetical protein
MNCMSSSVRSSIGVSGLFPHSPSGSILRHTGSNCQSKLLALTGMDPQLVCLCTTCSRRSLLSFNLATLVSFYFILYFCQASQKTKQLQATWTMIELAALLHPHSSSLHFWVINDQCSKRHVSCVSYFITSDSVIITHSSRTSQKRMSFI